MPRNVPFSAFLLLLIGVIGLAGYLTGALGSWFGVITGTGATTLATVTPATPAAPVSTVSTAAARSGSRRSTA